MTSLPIVVVLPLPIDPDHQNDMRRGTPTWSGFATGARCLDLLRQYGPKAALVQLLEPAGGNGIANRFEASAQDRMRSEPPRCRHVAVSSAVRVASPLNSRPAVRRF